METHGLQVAVMMFKLLSALVIDCVIASEVKNLVHHLCISCLMSGLCNWVVNSFVSPR